MMYTSCTVSSWRFRFAYSRHSEHINIITSAMEMKFVLRAIIQNQNKSILTTKTNSKTFWFVIWFISWFILSRLQHKYALWFFLSLLCPHPFVLPPRPTSTTYVHDLFFASMRSCVHVLFLRPIG